MYLYVNMESSTKKSGIPRDLRIEKISSMGVVRDMKNREHMPPKVLAIRRRARLAPSSRMPKLIPKTLKANNESPPPCMKATTTELSREKEKGMNNSLE
jgi:hypothetical protein